MHFLCSVPKRVLGEKGKKRRKGGSAFFGMLPFTWRTFCKITEKTDKLQRNLNFEDLLGWVFISQMQEISCSAAVRASEHREPWLRETLPGWTLPL